MKNIHTNKIDINKNDDKNDVNQSEDKTEIKKIGDKWIKTKVMIELTNDTFKESIGTINRTLKVGPSFCSKKYLLVNKLKLIRLDSPEQQIKTEPRPLERYQNNKVEDNSMEGNSEKKKKVFQREVVVFDDTLDRNRKFFNSLE